MFTSPVTLILTIVLSSVLAVYLLWLHRQQQEKSGALLWARWNDHPDGEILVKAAGDINHRSRLKKVPCEQIILGAEGDPRNGYKGWVLVNDWEQLGYPFHLGPKNNWPQPSHIDNSLSLYPHPPTKPKTDWKEIEMSVRLYLSIQKAKKKLRAKQK